MKVTQFADSRFIRVPQTLYNSILVVKLSKNERSILDLLIRLTYGCHTETAVIRPFQFSCIGIAGKHISKPRELLIEKGYIEFAPETNTYRILAVKIIEDSATALKSIQVLNKLIHTSLSRKGVEGVPKHDTYRTPVRTIILPETGVFNGYKPPPDSLFKSSKDSVKDSIKDSVKEKTIADKNLPLIDPTNFEVNNAEDNAALEAWKELEPHNPGSFGFYLKASKQIRPDVLLRFVHEIKADPYVKNPGAIFVKKVTNHIELIVK